MADIENQSTDVDPTGHTEAAQPPLPWTEPHPEIPYGAKPAPVPADWIVEHEPVNPNATEEAKALLRYLYKISGTNTLTGQHNFPGRLNYSTGLAQHMSGKVPAVYGTDWGFAEVGSKDSAFVRDELVQELCEQSDAGAIIALCWHAVPPTEDEPVTFSGSVQSKLTDQQFAELLTPGTELHNRWCAQVDVIVKYLLKLQDAHVPVLWRPYHEINGDWFWWGGHRGDEHGGTKQLFRMMYDRYTYHHKLNNLLWVWNPDRPARADREFVDYFPGLEYVDVLAFDCYGTFEQSYYDDLNALSGGKVLAIGETYELPPVETFRAQPKWSYYMVWAFDTEEDGGKPAADGGGMPDLHDLVNDSRFLSLDDPAYRIGRGLE